MVNQIETMRQMVEALENHGAAHLHHEIKYNKAIAAGKAAIEQAEKQEPVAFLDWYDNAIWGNEDFKAGCWRAWDAALEHATQPAAQPAPVPEGWKLVPVNPTPEMLAAADQGDREYTLRNFGDIQTVMQGPEDHYAAMLNAAPAAPVQDIEHCIWARNGNTPCPHTTAQRQWVGLTPDDIRKLEKENTVGGLHGDYCPTWDLIEAVEAKLREKNGGHA